MMHFSCDLCGKDLLADEARFIVRMEVFAAHDPTELTPADLDDDHLDEVSQLLRDEEDGLGATGELPPVLKKLRFDLCPSCHKRFLNDPLGKETANFDFSEN